MTQEVLNLALEALITITDAIYVNSQQEADAVYKANDAITAIKEALVQQELVVLQYPQIDIDWQREQQIKAQVSTPPQRTWVGLTISERDVCWRFSRTAEDAMEAVEAKLKEKNT